MHVANMKILYSYLYVMLSVHLKIIFSTLIFLCVIISINLELVYCVLSFPKLPHVSQFYILS